MQENLDRGALCVKISRRQIERLIVASSSCLSDWVYRSVGDDVRRASARLVAGWLIGW